MENKFDIIKRSDEYSNIYSKVDFTINATTKEQYLAFKKYMVDEAKIDNVIHHESVAYWLFKHRIGCDFKNRELVDNMKLREILDNQIVLCWKMLYHGENSWIYGGGGDRMKYEAIPNFKKQVIEIYNKFAEGKYEIIDNKVKLKK